jgi:hypothetical protein
MHAIVAVAVSVAISCTTVRHLHPLTLQKSEPWNQAVHVRSDTLDKRLKRHELTLLELRSRLPLSAPLHHKSSRRDIPAAQIGLCATTPHVPSKPALM